MLAIIFHIKKPDSMDVMFFSTRPLVLSITADPMGFQPVGASLDETGAPTLEEFVSDPGYPLVFKDCSFQLFLSTNDNHLSR